MVLYPNKLPESERVCPGICTVHEANKAAAAPKINTDFIEFYV